MGKPRILLADDHTLIVEALTKLLDSQFEIAGTVADGRALLEKAAELRPDVIVLDLGLPVLNGFAAGERLKKLLPRTKLIVLTANEDTEVAAEALQTWASGFLFKKSAGSELVKAIQEVLKGRAFVTSHVTQNLPGNFVRDPQAECLKSLTLRQREVLRLLAEGRTMNEAADLLRVTPRTVAFHEYKIMEDFDLKTNSDLLRLASKERIIS